jgi:hypothetical protein
MQLKIFKNREFYYLKYSFYNPNLYKMLLSSIIILFSINFCNSIDISTNKLAGLGLQCKNRIWGTNKYNSTISANTRKLALEAKLQPLPVFNDSIYLAGYYNRVQSDKMLTNLYERLSDLVRVECVDYKGEYLQKIEDYLNNIVNAKSWSSVAHDREFDYFYGRAYWIELYSSKNLLTFLFKLFEDF